MICLSPRLINCSTIVELIECEAMGLASRGAGSRISMECILAKDSRGLPAGQSFEKSQVKGAPYRRDWRFEACVDCNATHL